MSLVGGQSFDACCKPSFLLIIFSSWDFSAPIIYVCKRNQTGQNRSVRFLMPSFDPLCPFPMTQWMPWPNAFTGIGIALSFRPYVHPFRLSHVSIACLLWTICQNFSLQWRQMSIKPYHFVCFPSVSSAICLGWLQKRHQISASLALCAGKPLVANEFPSQRANTAGSVSM